MLRIHLFAEDFAHEAFFRALLQRLAREAGVSPVLTTVSGRGGHGMALSELVAWQRQHSHDTPGALIVMIDANCMGWTAARASALAKVESTLFTSHVVGCPDPHIERWFLADPVSLKVTLGARVTKLRRKCDRALYKLQLAEALRDAGHVLTLDGIEFAADIVDAMDLFRAGKSEPSLKHFIDGVRALLLTERTNA